MVCDLWIFPICINFLYRKVLYHSWVEPSFICLVWNVHLKSYKNVWQLSKVKLEKFQKIQGVVGKRKKQRKYLYFHYRFISETKSHKILKYTVTAPLHYSLYKWKLESFARQTCSKSENCLAKRKFATSICQLETSKFQF